MFAGVGCAVWHPAKANVVSISAAKNERFIKCFD